MSPGDSINNHLGKNVLVVGGSAEGGTLLEGLDERGIDLGDVVATDGRSPLTEPKKHVSHEVLCFLDIVRIHE
jgi:hypothetical protein